MGSPIPTAASALLVPMNFRRENLRELRVVLVCLVMRTPLPTAILQFHGDESDEFCSQFNKPFWKSIAVKDASSLPLISSNSHPSAQEILLETFSVNLDGGTGQTFDWDIIKDINLSNGYVLAGGINASNIDAAISLNPWCIDINSGVESQLGLKDTLLMTDIMKRFNHG